MYNVLVSVREQEIVKHVLSNRRTLLIWFKKPWHKTMLLTTPLVGFPFNPKAAPVRPCEVVRCVAFINTRMLRRLLVRQIQRAATECERAENHTVCATAKVFALMKQHERAKQQLKKRQRQHKRWTWWLFIAMTMMMVVVAVMFATIYAGIHLHYTHSYTWMNARIWERLYSGQCMIWLVVVSKIATQVHTMQCACI